MGGPDGRHGDDLAVDELDAVVLAEDPGLGHAVVFVHREAASRERHSHTIGPRHRGKQVAHMVYHGAEARRERHRTVAGRTVRARAYSRSSIIPESERSVSSFHEKACQEGTLVPGGGWRVEQAVL